MRNFFFEVNELPLRRGWQTFTSAFERVEQDLNWGTTGWVNEGLYEPVQDFLDRNEAPEVPRAVIDFHHGLAAFDWEEAADAADVLVPLVADGQRWVRPTVLLDGSVVAYLKVGRPTAARNAMNTLDRRTQREPGNLRTRLLDALIDSAAAAAGS